MDPSRIEDVVRVSYDSWPEPAFIMIRDRKLLCSVVNKVGALSSQHWFQRITCTKTSLVLSEQCYVPFLCGTTGRWPFSPQIYHYCWVRDIRIRFYLVALRIQPHTAHILMSNCLVTQWRSWGALKLHFDTRILKRLEDHIDARLLEWAKTIQNYGIFPRAAELVLCSFFTHFVWN